MAGTKTSCIHQVRSSVIKILILKVCSVVSCVSFAAFVSARRAAVRALRARNIILDACICTQLALIYVPTHNL